MSYNSFEAFSLQPKDVLSGKPIHLGYANVELSKLLMYETYYDNLQTSFDPNLEDKLQLRYMDCDSFVLITETNGLLEDLGRLQQDKDMFDFS